MTARREFTKAIKRAAALRSGGHCEACGVKLGFGSFHYDHDLPDFLGGEPTLENCRVLCIDCHKAKTRDVDTPRIVKSRGQRDMALNIKSAAKLTGAGFRRAPKQHRASTGIEPKFEGDVLARRNPIEGARNG